MSTSDSVFMYGILRTQITYRLILKESVIKLSGLMCSQDFVSAAIFNLIIF